MKLNMFSIYLEWDCSWNWQRMWAAVEVLLHSVWVEGLREEDLHGGNQNHRNSISRSGVMTPLLGRASGEGLTDWLPTLDSHHFSSQHTQTGWHVCVRIIRWYLRRVNHFLRPPADGPARPEMVLQHSAHLVSTLYLSLCPTVHIYFPLKLWLLFNLWV